MSQTPRKFSEKIAILERKSRAEVDEFTQVMQDVKKITTTRSPHITPTSTPYPCSPTGGPGSSSTIQTPSATESPIGLMPDGYNLGGGYVMHPLSGTPYQRSGGSLPNVHQMVQQKPGQMPQMPMSNEQWVYWQTAQTSAGGPNQTHSQNHSRTRSPGSAAHYHPYRNSSGNVSAQAAHPINRNERIPPMDHMMHLQPPDASWSKSRSDPAIHMNTMQQALYYTPNNPQFIMNQQQQAQFQNQQAQYQQQQWAQMQNGMPQNPNFYGTNMTNGGGTMNNMSNGQASNQAVSQANVPQQQQGSAHQTPIHSQPGSTASSASSVPICMSSPQHQQSQGSTPVPNQQIPQYNNAYLKQSPVGSPDMSAVGSLPNMHSPVLQQQYKVEPNPTQSYYDYDYNSQNQQEPLQSAPATMQQYCNGGSIYAYNQSQVPQNQVQTPQYMRPQHQLTMPQGVGSDSSQSAPTSPAQAYANNPLQPQWTSSRHYSASPDNQGIPRVTLTRVEGNTECFQEEFQDLCLDSDIQQDIQHALIHGAEDHFDPATESQLINSTR